MRSIPRWLAIFAALAMVAAACGSDDGADDTTAATTAATEATTAATTAATTGATTAATTAETTAATEAPMAALSDVCPNPIIVQTDWFPEAEHGALYEMVGSGYTIDGANGVINAPLFTGGENQDINIEVRAGGPAIGFQNPIDQMYVEQDIMLGYVSTDEAVFGTEDTPTLAVAAPLDKNPQMLMWDPETYPEIDSIADLGEAGVTIRVFAGGTYIDVLVAQGVLSEDQIDPSYDGSPAVFVAEGGAIAQQGFASAEPWVYENDVPEWGKPVNFELIHDGGFPIYSQALAIRKAELENLRPCLEQFVPIVQQAVVDYAASPDRANAIIVEMVVEMDSFWQYPPELAAFSIAKQLEIGLVSNGSDSVVANMDQDRVQGVIDQMIAAGLDVPADLTAADVTTNEFIDDSIGLP